MKANAPEKIYIVIDPIWGSMSVNYNCNDTNNIEYSRTDAFIENAAEWIKNKAENYIVDTPLCCYFDYKRAVEDFKEYIKGE